MPETTEIKEESQSKHSSGGVRLFRTSLLMAGSALLGGLAVVVLNRNLLARLRQPHEAPETSVPLDTDDD